MRASRAGSSARASGLLSGKDRPINKHRVALVAAVLAAATCASTAHAYTYKVYVLKTPTTPERLLCSDIVQAGPAQAVRDCLARFGITMNNWAYDNVCRPYRSSHRTLHKDGTTPQYEYWIAAKPPYLNGC